MKKIQKKIQIKISGQAMFVFYRNYRGVAQVRRLQPLKIEYGQTPFHPEDQWLIECIDLDRNDGPRAYAMKDMRAASPAEMDAYYAMVQEELLALMSLPKTIDEIVPTYEQSIEWLANACEDALNDMLAGRNPRIDRFPKTD